MNDKWNAVLGWENEVIRGMGGDALEKKLCVFRVRCGASSLWSERPDIVWASPPKRKYSNKMDIKAHHP